MVDESTMTDDQKVAARLVWRLEVLQYRGRYTAAGEYVRLPTRVRRFSNGLPIGRIGNVLEALVDLAPYSGVVLFNGEKYDDSVAYRPTSTYIKKDDTLKTGTQDRGTYTIVQDLLLVDESGDVMDFTDGSACSQVTESTYHWDEPSIPDCKDGEQGITYRISDVQRDKETDLFSFREQKVQALTQHLVEYVSSASHEETKYVETWDNVYGEPGDFYQDDVLHGGVAVDVPDPEAFDQGEHIEVQVTENDDCTFKIQVSRTVTHEEIGAEYARYKDQYVIRTSDLDIHARSPLSKSGVEYSGGVKTTYETKDNPDGTYNNKVTVETERRVDESIVEFKKTLRGLVKTVTDRNQAAGLTSAGMTVGETRSSKKTEGGLYDNVSVSTLAEEVGNIGLVCQRSIFEHLHALSFNTGTENWGDVDEASGGHVRKRTSRRTEENTYDVTEEDNQEIEVTSSKVTSKMTLAGRVKVTVDRNVPVTSPSVTKVGQEQTVEKTPGGLAVKTTTDVPDTPAGVISNACAKNLGAHTDTQIENVLEAPADTDAGTPAQNQEIEKTIRRTEAGTVNVETKKTDFVPMTATSEHKWAHEIVRITRVSHDTQTDKKVAGYGETDASPDDRGAASTSATEFEPLVLDTGWIKWDSETKSPSQTLKYHCGVRVFKNLSVQEFKTTVLGDVPSGSNISPNVSYNKYGLVDGSVSYNKLYEWYLDGSGSGGGGQVATGTAYGPVYARGGVKYRMKYTTKVMQGTGWTPQFAADAANAVKMGPYTVLWFPDEEVQA